MVSSSSQRNGEGGQNRFPKTSEVFFERLASVYQTARLRDRGVSFLIRGNNIRGGEKM